MNISSLHRFSLSTLSSLLFLFLILAFNTNSGNAQPVLGAENTALGSGGTAYLSGFEATFWNPANLVINDYAGNLHFGVGETGILYEPVLSTDVAGDQFFNFTDSFYPYKPSAAQITTEQRNTILQKNYPRSRLISQHQTRADMILGGALWQRGNSALSIAARARYGSRIEVGRGWYSEEYISSGDQEIRDFQLSQQINRFYELSVGYAHEFTFIEGLIPRLSKLYIGIAPKVILAGPSFNATYNGKYLRTDNGSSEIYTTDFSYRTTGEYSALTSDYLSGSSPQNAIDSNLNRRIGIRNTGYGLGFDFGLTYLIPLGSELSILKDSPDAVVSRSLRFSFSLNDVGIVRYNQNPLELSSSKDTLQVGQEPPKDAMFIGAGGQYLSYFNNVSTIGNPIKNATTQKSSDYSALLPTSLNAGVLIDLSRVKLMGDIRLGLDNTAFTDTKLTINLGVEARPLPSVPVRFGTRLAAGTPTHFGLGTGIETKHWDLSIGSQVIVRSTTFTTELVGGALAGIQFHF